MRYVLTLSAVASMVALLTAFATAEPKQVKPLVGVLIDQHCAASMLTKPNPEAAAAEHPRACAMKEACERSGYGVIVGSEFIKFDPKGDLLAKDFLNRSPKDKDLRIFVEGIRNGDHVNVDAISAAPDAAK